MKGVSMDCGHRARKQAIDVAAIVLLGAATAFGCGGSAARPPASATAGPSADEEEAVAGLVEHHRHHHHGGVMLLIVMSLDTLGVSPDQHASVDAIRRDLHARTEPAYAAEQNLLNMLADGLAAGIIDPAKVDAAVAQLTSAAATTYDASADALNRLHAVLTPPQRAAVVDKLEAHWSVWQRANNEDDLAQLASELDLSREQVDKIRANVAESMRAVPRFDPQEITAHIHTFGDAFRAPTFDAKMLTTGPSATSHMVAWSGAHMARVIEAASPVLTPEQRANLAQILHEHAKHNPSANGD